MYTAAFDRFIEPARRKPQIWRLIAGIILIVLIYIIGIAAIFLVIWLVSGTADTSSIANQMVDASTPIGALMLMLTFVGMVLAPMAVVRVLHGRTVRSLFGRATTVLRDFTIAAGIVFVIYCVLIAIWSIKFDAVPNLPFRTWLTVLPLALLGLLVQTAAEELVFRGYLLQQLAARFRSPLIWMLVPALLFGLVHFDPGKAGNNAWLMVIAAGVFGLVAADLTRVTGSLGASWGFHFANNLFAVVFIAVGGTIPGLSLYLTPYTVTDTNYLPVLVLADLAVMIFAWWILRRTLRR